jgi:transposase InsO family protein
LVAKRHFTPDERRQAVEAYQASELSQHAFARQWGLSHLTLGVWVRKYEREGPQGLERLAAGPVRRRGKAPLAPALQAEIVAVRRANPEFGWKRVRSWLWRFAGLAVSTSSVRRVSAAAGLPAAEPVARRRRGQKKPPRRFERSRPGELWQSDITYLNVPWRRAPLYLIVWLDDHSRYVVGWGLYAHQRAEIVLDTFEEASARWGSPTEALTDQGRQYFAWRGKSAFTKLLDRLGIKHVVARAHHPETVGKCERLWATVKKELWERVRPRDLDEARERLGHFFGHHNHYRPHESLGGMVPADRFFGVEGDVRRAVEETVAKNALRLALGEAPRRPVFLVGQIDGQAVSVHGESGRVVVQTPDGARREIATQDLGLGSRVKAKEVQDDEHEDEGQGGAGGDDAAGGAVAGGDACDGGQAGAAGPEAHDLPGAQGGAGAGTGAVAERERGGSGAGPQDGDDGAQGVAGQEQP